MTNGSFIVLEGIDGSGTTTQINGLHDYIKSRDKYADVLTTHEPWKNEEIKKKLSRDKDAYSGGKEMTRLFVDDRHNHLNNLIVPNMNQGVIVLSDRYSLSTYAYQGTQGVSFNTIKELHDEQKIIVPDLTFFLDVNYEVAKERITKRGDSLEKFETNERFTKDLINKYRALSEMEDIFGEVIKIDGNKSARQVKKDICEKFEEFYSNF